VQSTFILANHNSKKESAQELPLDIIATTHGCYFNAILSYDTKKSVYMTFFIDKKTFFGWFKEQS
jgi:hypothetical protein